MEGDHRLGKTALPNYTEEARIIRELTRAGSGPDPFSSALRHAHADADHRSATER